MAEEATETMMSDEAQMIRFAVRISVAFGLFIVALWAFATFRPRYREIEFELPQDLINARTRWMANPVAHYRFTITRYPMIQMSSITSCRQEFEIVHENVIHTIYNDCNPHSNYWRSRVAGKLEPTLTVTGLFDKLADETTTVRFLSGPACGDLEVVKTLFHPQYGYPLRIEYVEERATLQNMGLATYAKYRGNSNSYSCLAIAMFTRGHIEITLNALP